MRIILTIIAVFLVTFLNAQENFMFRAYVKAMSVMQTAGEDGNMMIENILHNRLDADWYMSDKITLSAGLRNRIIAGNNVMMIPGYDEYVSRDYGYLDLSWLWADKRSVLGISQFDRLMLDITIDKLQITFGRQRINWGQTFVWNPNDLFNTYSYFDFDYEERPGSDALRLQYYLGESGKIESSTSIDSLKRITSALLYRFNSLGYDFQFLGGIFKEEDLVIGAGWSGSIVGGGFSGELSYYYPLNENDEEKPGITATLHYDYTFSNSLNLQFEALYNGFGSEDPGGLGDVIFMDLNPKNLFMTRYAFFGSAGYQISPLFYASLSGMYGPQGKFIYLGPAITYSISDSMELAAFGQYFSMDEISPQIASSGNAVFVRLKWSF